MKRRFASSSKFALYLVCLGVLVSGAVHAQTEKNFVQVNYTYPAPNSSQISAKTTIGIRYGEAVMRSALQHSAIIVTGSLSGNHIGKFTLALDGRTVIFTPEKIFFSGEKIQVNSSPLTCLSGKNTIAYSFAFQISKSRIHSHPLLARGTGSSEVPSNAFADEPWGQDKYQQ